MTGLPTCVWRNAFEDYENINFAAGSMVIDILSIPVITWLCYSYKNQNILGVKLLNTNSYNIIHNLFVTCLTRIVISLSTTFGILQPLVEVWFEPCDFFAFINTFLSALEVELLTHACIERYVAAKYITNGWTIPQEHYTLYFNLCLMFSIIYSSPPLYGLGNFDYGFDCSLCTFDLILPNNWRRHFIVLIYFLRSLKPAGIMVVMLFWALRLENNFDSTMKRKSELHFTLIILIVASVNLVCWFPLAFFKGWVLLSQIMYGQIVRLPSPYYLVWAMRINETSPGLNALAMILMNCQRLRKYLDDKRNELRTYMELKNN